MDTYEYHFKMLIFLKRNYSLNSYLKIFPSLRNELMVLFFLPDHIDTNLILGIYVPIFKVC
jgi:hypothetical protein